MKIVIVGRGIGERILKTIFQVGDLVWVQDMATGKWDIPGKISMGKRRTSMGRVEEMYW